MEIIALHNIDHASWEKYKQAQVLILGHFDGIHMGHAHVIQRALMYGKCHQLPVSLMTFHPHPQTIFGQLAYTRLLTPLKEKERLLKQFGLDRVYIVTFHHLFANLGAQQFVRMIFLLGAKHIVVGFDYRFGQGGKGNVHLLKQWGKDYFTVDAVPVFIDKQQREKVSSTRIRSSLLKGDMMQAHYLLGRPYMMRGNVIHGQAKGRTIGFPTANIKLEEDFFIPAYGVYVVKVLIAETWHGGVLNIGLKPTVEKNRIMPTIELHILNFDRQIYGETVTFILFHYIRAERKFEGIQQLVLQITSDIEQARQQLHHIEQTFMHTLSLIGYNAHHK